MLNIVSIRHRSHLTSLRADSTLLPDMSDELIDTWVPDCRHETPSEALERNPSYGMQAQQCSRIIRAILDGCHTTAQIVAACEDRPDLDLVTNRVHDRLRAMAMDGVVCPYMQPLSMRRKTTFRWIWVIPGANQEAVNALHISTANGRYVGSGGEAQKNFVK